MVYRLVGYSAPSHYLNQCGRIVNWTLRNKLQIKIQHFLLMQMNLKMSFAKQQPFIIGLNMIIAKECPWQLSKRLPTDSEIHELSSEECFKNIQISNPVVMRVQGYGLRGYKRTHRFDNIQIKSIQENSVAFKRQCMQLLMKNVD